MPMKKMKLSEKSKRWIVGILAAVVAVGGYYVWKALNSDSLPEGIARGNGRIEAVEIDVASKRAGRVKEILVNEGDFVKAGQVLAIMDTDQLMAQKRQAEAQLERAKISVETAKSLVTQREAELRSAEAVVAQREAQFDNAQRKLARSEELIKSKSTSQQVFDDDRAAADGARANLESARAQVAASVAAISAAKAAVVDAESAVDAARANIESINADIVDSTLTSPRDGRVQYRVAQPGEVLSAGGRVLNLVDLGDVFMTFFLPTAQAGKIGIGSDARIVLDAAPQYVIPAKATFVSDVAQFTPKTVETEEERQKLMFRVKAHISPELLQKYRMHVKTGLPGVAYVKLDPKVEWPAAVNKTPLQ